MPRRPAKTPKPSPVEDLLARFDGASLEEKAEFALRRCATMANAIQTAYGPFTDPRAKPLQILQGGQPHHHIIASVDGRRLSNGAILELLIGVPERWLTVWIDGLPNRVYACILTPYEVSRIELNARSFLRWPDKPARALSRYVDHLETDPSRGETENVRPSWTPEQPDIEAPTS